MALIAKETVTDGTSATLHPRQNYSKTGTMGALNAEVVMPCDGCQTVAFTFIGTSTQSVFVSTSADGVNWFDVPFRQLGVVVPLLSVALTVGPTQLFVDVARAGFVRVRCSSYTSGSFAVTATGQIGRYNQDNEVQRVNTSVVSATAAVATIAAAVFAAPGAGLRVYITGYTATRFATAALTAGAAPVLVTTTGLTGTPGVSIPADAALQGTIYEVSRDFAAIPASAQNLAVTMSFPAVASVIGKTELRGYVAP